MVKKRSILVLILLVVLPFGAAINPPGIPHSILGKAVFYNGSLAGGTNVSLIKDPGTVDQQRWLDENMGSGTYGNDWFELNLGNVEPDMVWLSSGPNLSLENDIAWATGDRVLIHAYYQRPDGLVQTAKTYIILNNSDSGYQVLNDMVLNELPSTPDLGLVDSSHTPENASVYVRKPYINWSASTDIFTDGSIKDITGDVRYQLQISNSSSFSPLLVNTTIDDLVTFHLSSVNMTSYTDDLLVGTYYYHIRPYDGVDLGAWSETKTFEVKPVNITLHLYKGYNLISLPAIKEVLDTGEHFEKIEPKDLMESVPDGVIKSITRWDPGTQSYPLPACQRIKNPFTGVISLSGCEGYNLTLGQGFYVELNQSFNLSYVGRPIEAINYSLKEGYNLIGYNNRLGSMLAMDYINHYPNLTIQSITRWDSEQQKYPLPACKYTLNPFTGQGSYSGCDSFNMTNGDAYFIEASDNTNHTFRFLEGNE